jgi:DNA-binding MarR family transcriptional regulator
VTRRVSEDDARSRTIALTPEGRQLVDRVADAHMANEHRLVAGLSSAEQRQLADLLEKWGRALENGESAG